MNSQQFLLLIKNWRFFLHSSPTNQRIIRYLLRETKFIWNIILWKRDSPDSKKIKTLLWEFDKSAHNIIELGADNKNIYKIIHKHASELKDFNDKISQNLKDANIT